MMDTVEAPAGEHISYDDFLKVDIRSGTIVKAEIVPKSEKLLKLEVNLGALGARTIVAGIAKSYNVDGIIGTRCLVVVNLAPRKMMGIVSHGMLLAGEVTGSTEETRFVTLAACSSTNDGERIG